MLVKTISKAALIIRRLDLLRKRMAVRDYLQEKKKAGNSRQREKERKAAESLIERTLAPFFIDQIQTAAARLSKMGLAEEKAKVQSGLTVSIFNPKEWEKKFQDTLYPALLKIALAGMDAEMRRIGLRVKRGYTAVKAELAFIQSKTFCPTGPGGGVDPTCSPNRGGGGHYDSIVEKIAKGETVTVPKSDVPKILDAAAKSSHKANLANLHIEGTELFDGSLYKLKRAEMPVLGKEHKPKFIQEMKKDGIDVRLERVDPSTLHPVQEEISANSSGGMLQAMREGKLLDDKDRLVVSRDNHIIDGHHRWAAAVGFSIEKEGVRIPIVRVDLSTDDLLKRALDYNKREGVESRALHQMNKSTASDYLHNLADPLDLIYGTSIDTPYGVVDLAFLPEYPDWMKKAIVEFLAESFTQPYWSTVNETTMGDIDQFIREGLTEGKSIAQIANDIVPQLLQEGRYAQIRARNIARTEAGHALNGARTMGIEAVIEELQDTGLHLQRVWHSVLGTTTRDTHAHLHGVPAGADGMWSLGGTRCRWPGDAVLPPSERCNCQCTVSTEFEMTQEEADERILQYEQRIAKASWEKIRSKVFCPTGPGGGVDPTCKPGEHVLKSGEKLHDATRGKDGVWRDGQGKEMPPHIQKLEFPPSFTKDGKPNPNRPMNVRVNLNPKGDLLAIYENKKGRERRLYSASHNMQMSADKFGRVNELRQIRKKIMKEVAADIEKGVEEAVVLDLIMKTGMRPGNTKQDPLADYKSYGAVSLEGRHVVEKDGKLVVIRYVPGKKQGREIETPVYDKALGNRLKELAKKAGPNGRLFDTSQAKVRAYSKTKDGGGFKTKDHRTALGTETAVELINQKEPPKTIKEYKKAIKEVSTEVSVLLGNSPSMCVKFYIDPHVWAGWKSKVGA